MSIKIRKIEVKSFKAVENAYISLDKPIVFLLGSNLSGKSSMLESINFLFNAIESYRLSSDSRREVRDKLPEYSLPQDQFIFRPAESIHALRHGGPLTQKKAFSFNVKFSHDSRECSIEILFKSGKNLNIKIVTDPEKSPLLLEVQKYGQEGHSFSLLVPGLSGIPVREPYHVPHRVRIGVAHGDCNLYLRNVLHLLLNDSDKSHRLEVKDLLKSLFPEIKEIYSKFDPKIEEFVKVYLEFSNNKSPIPIELCGLGILQCLQLFSYCVYFRPKILLLDEPDSHLHPDNQRKLAQAIRMIVDKYQVSVIIATHSRHLIHDFVHDSNAEFYVMRRGECKRVDSKRLTSALLEMGSIDRFDRIYASDVIVFSEDQDARFMEIITRSFAADPGNPSPFFDAIVVPFSGRNNMDVALSATSYFALDENVKAKRVFIHIDSDGLMKKEAFELAQKLTIECRKKSAFKQIMVWLSFGYSIESMFCQISHLRDVLGRDKMMKVLIASRANFIALMSGGNTFARLNQNRGIIMNEYGWLKIDFANTSRITKMYKSILDGLSRADNNLYLDAYSKMLWVVSGREILRILRSHLGKGKEEEKLLQPSAALANLVKWCLP